MRHKSFAEGEGSLCRFCFVIRSGDIEKDNVEKETVEKKSFLKKIPFGKMAAVTNVMVAAYSVINIFYKFTYQSRCRDFYGVPAQYFSDTVGKRLILFSFVAVILLLLCLIPFYTKEYDVFNLNNKKDFIYHLCLLIGYMPTIIYLDLVCLSEILKGVYKLNIIYQKN